MQGWVSTDDVLRPDPGGIDQASAEPARQHGVDESDRGTGRQVGPGTPTGGRGPRIELRWFGRAHTRGDIVVHLPERGVVFAGDLVSLPVPLVGSTSFPLPRALPPIRSPSTR